MPKKVHRIHSLPDDAPWQPDTAPRSDRERSAAQSGLDRLLAVQRPVVLAHLRSIRLRHRDATPQQLVTILERRYLAAVTSGGAAVGATAVIPGIGTGVSLTLSGVEVAGFLEATALFAQSVTEVHGIRVSDPERARGLVLALMLGSEGTSLLAQFTTHATTGTPGMQTMWGELITSKLPRVVVSSLTDRLTHAFMSQFAVRGSASVIGKALPFGIGAAIGAGGNHLLGKRVVKASRTAFGPAPLQLPAELEPRLDALPVERHILAFTARTGAAIGRTAAGTTRSVGRGIAKAKRLRRRGGQAEPSAGNDEDRAAHEARPDPGQLETP